MENISLQSIKWESIKSIFAAIAASDRISRADISSETGLSLMTVGKVADALLAMHVIEQSRPSRSSAGRRAGLLSIAQDNFAVILDLTSRNFMLSLVNVRLDIIDKYHYSYNEDFYFEENLTLFLREAGIFLSRTADLSRSIGCAVSVPGPYAADTDRTYSSRLPELNTIPIAETVETHLHIRPDYIEAGYNAAATSNIARINQNREKIILYWFVGENHVSGTIVHHGQILRGAHNAAGNFGQMRISRGTTLESALRPNAAPQENAYELAKAIHNVLRVIDPDCIILECELYKGNDDFVETVRQTLCNSFGFRADMLPEFISGGCKFRHAHRGLTMTLRERWLSELVFGEKSKTSKTN